MQPVLAGIVGSQPAADQRPHQQTRDRRSDLGVLRVAAFGASIPNKSVLVDGFIKVDQFKVNFTLE